MAIFMPEGERCTAFFISLFFEASIMAHFVPVTLVQEDTEALINPAHVSHYEDNGASTYVYFSGADVATPLEIKMSVAEFKRMLNRRG